MMAGIALALPMAIALLAPTHSAHAASIEGAGEDYWPRVLFRTR